MVYESYIYILKFGKMYLFNGAVSVECGRMVDELERFVRTRSWRNRDSNVIVTEIRVSNCTPPEYES
jgi:hypothetical protein